MHALPTRPTLLVTGTRGKSTVAHLLRAMQQGGGCRATILERPVDAAPQGRSDLAVLTRLGERSATPELLAALASAHRVVLNADDAPSREVGRDLARPVTWFSMDEHNPLVAEHLERGGDACVLRRGALALCAGGTWEAILELTAVPVALGGAARHQVANALAALAGAVGLGWPLEDARTGLAAPALSPRRYALGGLQVVLDLVPDAPAAEAALRTAAELPAERRLALPLSPALRDAPALSEAARLARIDLAPALDLRAALGDARVGDVLLVLTEPGDGAPAALLGELEAAAWRPGVPLPG